MKLGQQAAQARASTAQYLPEVQGLRAVAALLVAIYHIWLSRVSGGVDVFFVVSAFLMTRALMRREPLGPRQVLDHYARVARRVLPGAALVVAATALAALWLMPDVHWRWQIVHALASLQFRENWQLATEGAGYLQLGTAASPFQQFWALSLQGQMYLAIPLLLLAGSIAGRWQGRPLAVMSVGWLLILGVSLRYSIWLTGEDQASAYFDSFARAWQFAAGVLLGLWIDRIRLPKWTARLLGWLGLAALLMLGVVVDVSRQFPGYLAALPVAAALAVIVASASGAGNWLLGNRVAQRLGDIAFAFYLWHWPLLVFLRYWTGTGDVGVPAGLGVIVAAGGLAYVSTRWVEAPFRLWQALASRPWRSLLASAALLVPALLVVQLWSGLAEQRVAAAEADKAAVLAGDRRPLEAGRIVPATIIARNDVAPNYQDRCNQTRRGEEVRVCAYGDPNGSRTIALVGGSHSTQWSPVLSAIGTDRGYRVLVMTKDACIFTALSYGNSSCQIWNAALVDELDRLRPDLVVTIGTRPVDILKVGAEEVPQGYEYMWRELGAMGLNVLAIRDNPWLGRDPVECVALRGAGAPCGRERLEQPALTSPTEALSLANVRFADLTADICDERYCPATEGGVMVYRDRSHLTVSYTMTRRRIVEQEIEASLMAFAP